MGQNIDVVNADQTTHNIHPVPKDNREWNESQPPGAAPIEKSFAREEIAIPVKCNVHPWMKAYMAVLPTLFPGHRQGRHVRPEERASRHLHAGRLARTLRGERSDGHDRPERVQDRDLYIQSRGSSRRLNLRPPPRRSAFSRCSPCVSFAKAKRGEHRKRGVTAEKPKVDEQFLQSRPPPLRCLHGLLHIFLLIAGALVTSNDAGLSIPDWPLAYGSLVPPMVGGILYEYGHRMIRRICWHA